MRKTKFINPMWEDHRRPVAYVRALEVLIPGRYFNEEAVKAADDEAVIALVTAFASCTHPGMPALLVLGF